MKLAFKIRFWKFKSIFLYLCGGSAGECVKESQNVLSSHSPSPRGFLKELSSCKPGLQLEWIVIFLSEREECSGEDPEVVINGWRTLCQLKSCLLGITSPASCCVLLWQHQKYCRIKFAYIHNSFIRSNTRNWLNSVSVFMSCKSVIELSYPVQGHHVSLLEH